MKERNARTFGEFMSMVRAERVTAITSVDRRPLGARKGPREYRGAIRNKAANYEHCADRTMIHDEFAKLLWKSQKERGGPLAEILTDDLLKAIDDETGDSVWRQRGLMFGQRRTYWDTGTLGRCDLEPTERCVPARGHATRRGYLCRRNREQYQDYRTWGAEPRASDLAEEREKIKNISTSGPHRGFWIKDSRQPKRIFRISYGSPRNSWNGEAPSQDRGVPIQSRKRRRPRHQAQIGFPLRKIIHGAVTVEKWLSSCRTKRLARASIAPSSNMIPMNKAMPKGSKRVS